MVEERVLQSFHADPDIKKLAPELERAVAEGRLPASEAAERLWRANKH
jgi:LAO/AO transport system kinase